MKIKRYPAGQTNVGSLAYAKGQIVSPGELARLTYAPYEAVTGALGKATDTLLYLNEVENRAIDAEDATRYDLDRARTEATLKRNAEQAKAENWTADQLQEANQQVIRGFATNIDKYSERNRERYAELIGIHAEDWAESTRLDANILRAQNAEARAEQTYELYIQNGLYDEALKHLAKNRDMGVYSADEASNRAVDISARQQAKEWAGKYEAAVQKGTEDKVLSEMGGANLNDAVWKYFTGHAQKINTTADEARAQINTERSIEWNDYIAGVTSATSRDEIKGWIRERPWLNDYQRNALFNALEQGEKTKGITLDIYSDREAKATRKAFNSELNPNASPEENATIAAGIAQRYRVVPEAWTNLVNYLASSEEPSALIEAGKYVMQMEAAAPGVNLHLNDKTNMKVSMYVDTVKRTNDPVSAAATVTAHFAGITEQNVEARKERWEVEDYGPGGKSPKDFIFEELTDRLSDTDTPIGQMFAGDLGVGVFNLEDPYNKDTVSRSTLMEDTLQKLAYRYYTAGASEEVAIESAIRAARNMGFAATDVNYGVIWAGEEEYKYQIQQNPITRRGDSVIPREQIRDVVYKDMQKLEFLRLNDPAGTKPRKYDMEEVVIGDGIVDEIKTVNGKPNPNYGQLKWPLMSRGSQLTVNGYPQYFRFDPEPTQEQQQQVSEEEALSRIEQATLESRLKQATGGLF